MRNVFTNSPDHMNDSDGRENMTPRPYDLPAVRGKARADEITAAVQNNTEPRYHGDVVHDAAVHELLSLARDGEATTYGTAAPSPFVATVSERKVKRGKRGTSVTVTRRGRTWVGGDSTAMDDTYMVVPRVVAQHAIDALRSGNAFGHADGDALARLTTLLYGGLVPDEIGTDSYSWSEATPALPMAPADMAEMTEHRVGITGGLVPAVDAATAPRGHGRHYGAISSTRAKVVKPATRRTLPTPRVRKSDPRNRDTVKRGPYAWYLVTEHRCGTDTPVLRTTVPRTEHRDDMGRLTYVSGARDTVRTTSTAATVMHLGHRTVNRGATVREASTDGSKSTVVDTFVIGRLSELATIARSLRNGGRGRYGWRTAAAAGTLTVDARGRWSATDTDRGVIVRQVSLKALTAVVATL